MNRNSHQNLVNSELTPRELQLYRRVHLEHIFSVVNCSSFSFIKISIYTGVSTVLKVEFLPDRIHNFTTSGVEVIRSLTLPTISHTIPANEYKYFVMPVEGEKVKITLTNTGNDTETYMKTTFSNNFHYCSND